MPSRNIFKFLVFPTSYNQGKACECFFIYKDIIWIYAHIFEQLLAEISDINPEPNLIELFP